MVHALEVQGALGGLLCLQVDPRRYGVIASVDLRTAQLTIALAQASTPLSAIYIHPTLASRLPVSCPTLRHAPPRSTCRRATLLPCSRQSALSARWTLPNDYFFVDDPAMPPMVLESHLRRLRRLRRSPSRFPRLSPAATCLIVSYNRKAQDRGHSYRLQDKRNYQPFTPT